MPRYAIVLCSKTMDAATPTEISQIWLLPTAVSTLIVRYSCHRDGLLRVEVSLLSGAVRDPGPMAWQPSVALWPTLDYSTWRSIWNVCRTSELP